MKKTWFGNKIVKNPPSLSDKSESDRTLVTLSVTVCYIFTLFLLHVSKQIKYFTSCRFIIKGLNYPAIRLKRSRILCKLPEVIIDQAIVSSIFIVISILREQFMFISGFDMQYHFIVAFLALINSCEFKYVSIFSLAKKI